MQALAGLYIIVVASVTELMFGPLYGDVPLWLVNVGLLGVCAVGGGLIAEWLVK